MKRNILVLLMGLVWAQMAMARGNAPDIFSCETESGKYLEVGDFDDQLEYYYVDTKRGRIEMGFSNHKKAARLERKGRFASLYLVNKDICYEVYANKYGHQGA